MADPSPDSTDTSPAEPSGAPVSDGEDLAGYRAIRERAALLDPGDRAMLEVRGGSAREHFGGLLTNHVEELEEGEGLYCFMLTAKGRPVAEMRVMTRSLGDEEVLLVDLPAACLESATEHLGRFLPPRLARYERIEDVQRWGVVGPRAGEALRDAGVMLPGEDHLAHRALPENGALGPGRVVRREEIEGPGFDVYLPAGAEDAVRDVLEDAVRDVGGTVAGAGAREVWRVERGLPVYGSEIHPDVLPQETGQQDRAVDFDKGCYTGQEVVARIHYRGKVNRLLRGISLDDEVPLPDPGTELFADGRSRGSVTTSVRSPRLGAIALAYVRREIAIGDPLAVGSEEGPRCRVVALPFESP